MNIIALLLAVTERGQAAPPMLIIIYWLLIVLWAIGALGFKSDNPNYPTIVRGTNVVVLILFAILGFYVFGF